MPHTFSVPTLTEPTRLDKFLVVQFPAVSRSRIQEAVRKGHVLVNKKKVAVHHFLKSGDEVSAPEFATPTPAILTPDVHVKFTTIHEEKDFIIIDKPTGLVVHPAPGLHESTLVHGLLAQYPELAQVGDDTLRPGIVHRLDREVSGLMVVARTPDAFTFFKRQFMERLIEKKYTALVVGRMANNSGTINFPLARSKRGTRKVAARSAADDDTREAVTHYEVTQQYQQVALVTVEIETGRTPQIRAHLAALGYPIVGDTLYRPKHLSFKATPNRLFLHASSLAFTAPDGTHQKFTSSLPPELEHFLAQLH